MYYTEDLLSRIETWIVKEIQKNSIQVSISGNTAYIFRNILFIAAASVTKIDIWIDYISPCGSYKKYLEFGTLTLIKNVAVSPINPFSYKFIIT